MITGSYGVIYPKNAEADCALFAEVLQMPHGHAGGGWLIFPMPAAEVAFHPDEENGPHSRYLMYEDLQSAIEELADSGIRRDVPSVQDWRIVTSIRLLRGGRLGPYEPTHLLPAQNAG